MTEQATAANPRKHRWLRAWNVITLVLAAMFAGYRYTLHFRMYAKIAEIRRQGYPVTVSELGKWYPQPPPGENAADVFKEAFQHYANWESNKLERVPVVGKAQLPKHGEAFPEETQALAAEYLAANRESLELLHKGAVIRHARYPIDFEHAKPMEVKLPHLSKVRQGARLLCLDTVMHAEASDPSSAAQSVRSGISLAESLATEPDLISQLVRGACYYYACLGLERTLNRVVLTDKDLDQLIISLPKDDCAKSMHLSLIAERSMDMELFTRLGPNVGDFLMVVSGEPIEWGSGYRVPGYYLFLFYYTTGFTDLDMLCCADLMDVFIRISERPAEERMSAIPPVQARIQSLPRRCWVSRMFTDALGTAMIKNLRLVAGIRVARGALMVEQFRLANGRLPDNLAEFSPKLPNSILLDPFDGQPLRYKKQAKGYVVYSVGEDGNDDSGDEKKDITFTVER
jgi:hypothetical protein